MTSSPALGGPPRVTARRRRWSGSARSWFCCWLTHRGDVQVDSLCCPRMPMCSQDTAGRTGRKHW